jgi:hypothetical protein
MSKILTNSGSQDAGLRFEAGDTGLQAMNLQTDKCADRQADMIALRDFQSILSAFNSSELFETTMIDFDLPGIQGMERHLAQWSGPGGW